MKAELLATCGTHLRCLQAICEHIENDENGSNFSIVDLKQLHNLIEEWDVLKKSVEMCSGEDFIKQKYIKAKKNIDDLFNAMSELSSYADDIKVENFKSWEELKQKVTQLQMAMTQLHETKEQLLAVNLEVHRFMTNHGGDLDYRNCPLKDDITELYRRWEDAYENNESHLTRLEIVCNKWKIYNDKLRALRYNVKFIENLAPKSNCDTTNCISNIEETGNLKKSLQDLQKEAIILKDFLKGTPTWKSIDIELQDITERINKYTRTLQPSLKFEQPFLSQGDPDDQFEESIHLLEVEGKTRTLVGANGDSNGVPKRKSSRFWRIIRIAVPVQLALVFLYCLACYFEPNCCEMLNNFNFSLTPHLRYWRGPPPS